MRLAGIISIPTGSASCNALECCRIAHQYEIRHEHGRDYRMDVTCRFCIGL